MYSTYRNLSKLAVEFSGTLDEAICDYKSTDNPIAFSFIFCQTFRLTNKISNSYVIIDSDTRASIVSVELSKAIKDWDETKGAKFTSLLVQYITRACNEEYKSLNYDKRKANLSTVSYTHSVDETEEENNPKPKSATPYDMYIEDEYALADIDTTITKLDTLNESERTYCKLIARYGDSIGTGDIASILKMSSAGVCSIRKTLKSKLRYAFSM